MSLTVEQVRVVVSGRMPVCSGTAEHRRMIEAIRTAQAAAAKPVGGSSYDFLGTIGSGMPRGPYTFGFRYPTMDTGRGGSQCRLATRYDVQMGKTDVTAADFMDTPASELPVLPSKRRVQERLGHIISFVEPTFLPKSQPSVRATERRVRRSLQCVGTFDLDKLLREQRKLG